MVSIFKTTGDEAPPSINRALSIFLQAYAIEPKYIPNLLYLGHCHISLGDKETAKKYLKEATDMEAHGCDLGIQKECAELLKQC
ncbi:hypothetical protein GCK32_011376 [Trichostrongylus colubriformis]|uniref:Uncharacterized protein n=1 Tax=Trichostrongylus colubriformis TaxID=6319 RepID=A0AAN8IV72_TRICO